jgi:hypothetical protein
MDGGLRIISLLGGKNWETFHKKKGALLGTWYLGDPFGPELSNFHRSQRFWLSNKPGKLSPNFSYLQNLHLVTQRD